MKTSNLSQIYILARFIPLQMELNRHIQRAPESILLSRKDAPTKPLIQVSTIVVG
jgi:hypothetical protein